MAERTIAEEEARVLLDDVMEEAPPSRRRLWPWLLGAVLVAAALVVWLLVRNGGEAGAESPVAERTTGDVVRTDLVEVTTYAGTLGRLAGDPVTSSRGGTITAAAAAGDVIAQGDVLFEVDGEPVVLLYGASPAYRTIASSEGTISLTAAVNGTVTRVAAQGDVLESGDIAFVIDDQPTFVFAGEVPAWRTLEDGVDDGPDVQQLEQALVDLGYDPDESLTIDEEFTSNTEAMVERWQEDVGVEEDGVVDLGDVVFVALPSEVMAVPVVVGQTVASGQPIVEVGDGDAPSGNDVAQLEQALADLDFDPGPIDGTYTDETRSAVLAWQASVDADEDGVVRLGQIVFLESAIRVSDRLVAIGSTVAAGTPVLAATGSDIVVTLDLPAEDQGLVAEGDQVTIELPDNSTTPGTVETVDTVATVSAQGEAVFEVTVLLDDPTAATGLDEAPVDVDIVTDRVDGVMAVPVTALLALAEGGYAVELVDGSGATQLVAVDPGFYADGLVEIESADVEVGDRVVVP